MSDTAGSGETRIVDTARAFVSYCRAIDMDPQTTIGVLSAALGLTLRQCNMTWDNVSDVVGEVVTLMVNNKIED